MNLRGGSEVFLKENCLKMGCSTNNWQSFRYSKNNMSQLQRRGGRGHQRFKMSQLKMSQSCLRGGRVKPIETMSLNLQFFFLGGFPNCKLSLWKKFVESSRDQFK